MGSIYFDQSDRIRELKVKSASIKNEYSEEGNVI